METMRVETVIATMDSIERWHWVGGSLASTHNFFRLDANTVYKDIHLARLHPQT